ncbi:MAG TPA: RluA family pseudouridine synthase [Candidatus Parcubacteria bacterium]|nr:RluA family pseudouridine synthase [Candidatus Parcubacteria bacterium]
MDEKIKIIYEDNNLLVVDKPAGVVVFSEKSEKRGTDEEKTLIEILLEKYQWLKEVGGPPRYGIVHRLDKYTSGILLVAKNKSSLEFLQKQFKERLVEKKYLALVSGHLKKKEGLVDTFIGRSPKNRTRQRVYLPYEPGLNKKRRAVTFYKVLKRFKNYDLVEAKPKTGRKHEIRVHFAFLGAPIAGDEVYGFKNQPCPKGLKRQFLHACYLKIKTLDGEIKEFSSDLPKDLKEVLHNLAEIKN